MSKRVDLADVLSQLGSVKRTDLEPGDMIKELAAKGYKIVQDDPAAEKARLEKIKAWSGERWKGGRTVKVAAVSCTHLGSRKQQLQFLHAFYDRVQKEGIKSVLHAGDLFDGDGRVYRGHEYEVFAHGFDYQLKYGREHYPVRDGVTTYVIAGNHDWSFYQRGGADILEKLAEKRSDIKYLGAMSAKFEIEGVRFQMTHGMGGGAYARSYKMQKHIEQFAPENKPQVYLLGHFHSWAHLAMYRNVIGWQMGCFQSQTDFLKRLGLYPELGGLILELDVDSAGADRSGSDHDAGRKGVVAVRTELVPFYVPVEDDY